MSDSRKQYGPTNPRLPVFYERFNDLVDNAGGVSKVSEITGISRPTITFWYNGQRTPDAENLRIISKSFEVSVDYLLGRSDVSSRDEDIQVAQRTTGLSERAISALMRCSDTTIETINKIILAIGD